MLVSYQVVTAFTIKRQALDIEKARAVPLYATKERVGFSEPAQVLKMGVLASDLYHPVQDLEKGLVTTVDRQPLDERTPLQYLDSRMSHPGFHRVLILVV